MTISRAKPAGIPNYTTCTSSTRPASPAIGDSLYETDTAKYLIYSGATVGWTMPWNLPWGRVCTGASTNVTTSGATALAMTTAVAFTAVANRLYRVSLMFTALMTVSADIFYARSCDGSAGGTLLTQDGRWTIAPGGQGIVTYVPAPITMSAGSHSPVGVIQRVGGTGTAQTGYLADSTLTVDDIGPSGLPS